jgi:hypothetical protein
MLSSFQLRFSNLGMDFCKLSDDTCSETFESHITTSMMSCTSSFLFFASGDFRRKTWIPARLFEELPYHKFRTITVRYVRCKIHAKSKAMSWWSDGRLYLAAQRLSWHLNTMSLECRPCGPTSDDGSRGGLASSERGKMLLSRPSPTKQCKCKIASGGSLWLSKSASNRWNKSVRHFVFEETGDVKICCLSPQCISTRRFATAQPSLSCCHARHKGLCRRLAGCPHRPRRPRCSSVCTAC